MCKIVRENLPLRREEVSREEARARIQALGEPYKLEILDGIKGEAPITIDHIGDKWWDLCAGPHVESTGSLNGDALELEAVAGAYWRGDETKAQLQRVYGSAWESKEQMKAWKALQEEAARRCLPASRPLAACLPAFHVAATHALGEASNHPKFH